MPAFVRQIVQPFGQYLSGRQQYFETIGILCPVQFHGVLECSGSFGVLRIDPAVIVLWDRVSEYEASRSDHRFDEVGLPRTIGTEYDRCAEDPLVFHIIHMVCVVASTSGYHGQGLFLVERFVVLNSEFYQHFSSSFDFFEKFNQI